MNEARAFCPRCGDPLPADWGRPADRDPGPTSGRSVELCPDCYFENFELVDVPDRITVRVCATCGAVYRGNRWVDVGAEDYTDVAIEAVSDELRIHRDAVDVAWRVEPEQVDVNTIRMHCVVSAVVRGRPLEETVVVPVRIARETCTRCSRIAGDYYGGIVQVRSVDRPLAPAELDAARSIATEVVESMEATGDRNAFVTDVTETDAGIDIKVSTPKIGDKIARRLVDRFGGSVESSETLVTEDADGNEVYRVTYAVRLPPFVPGDVIDPDDASGPVLVTSTRGTVKGHRLTSGERYESSYEEGERPDARKLGTVEDAERTTLVTVEDDHAIQVLDPETYRSTTIARPPFLDPDAETVPVLKSRAGLHALPEDAVPEE